MLGATLARVATLTPPTLTMDTGFGMPASLNLVVGLVGPSGAGKTTAVAAARQLVPIDRLDIVADIPLGSGEGLVDVFFETVTEEENGKKVRKKRRTKTAALVCLDEGQALAEMGGRKGATLMPTVRSSWSGETIGQANASEETKRIVKAGTYRLALVVGFQATAAGAMLADQETGTAQRFVLFSATDPTIPLEPIAWPTEAVFDCVPPTIDGQTINVDDAIKKEIRTRAHAIRTAAVVADPLDSHRDLNRLKIAGLLAILAGRVEINAEDWRLSALVMDTSDAVRRWVMETNTATAEQLEDARTRAAIKRQRLAASALDNDAHARAVAVGARAIARLAHRRKGTTISGREAARAVSGKQRHEGERRRDDRPRRAASEWIRADGDGWVAGRSARGATGIVGTVGTVGTCRYTDTPVSLLLLKSRNSIIIYQGLCGLGAEAISRRNGTPLSERTDSTDNFVQGGSVKDSPRTDPKDMLRDLFGPLGGLLGRHPDELLIEQQQTSSAPSSRTTSCARSTSSTKSCTRPVVVSPTRSSTRRDTRTRTSPAGRSSSGTPPLSAPHALDDTAWVVDPCGQAGCRTPRDRRRHVLRRPAWSNSMNRRRLEVHNDPATAVRQFQTARRTQWPFNDTRTTPSSPCHHRTPTRRATCSCRSS